MFFHFPAVFLIRETGDYMSFCNATILKAFLGENSFLVSDPAPDGLAEAITQTDHIIRNYTGEDIPVEPDSAAAVLRNVACALVIWFTTGMQTDLTEQEYARRKTMYQEAMKTLENIKDGTIRLREDDEEAGDYDPPMFISTQRIDEMF
jgi:phage gp36-like protein